MRFLRAVRRLFHHESDGFHPVTQIPFDAGLGEY